MPGVTTYTPPCREPAVVSAGESWQWDRRVDDFPPSGGWTLAYHFVGPAAFTLDATTSDDGDYFEIRAAAATTAARAAGNYRVVGRVTDGTDTFEVFSGRIEVRPDAAEQGATLSHNRRMLNQIEAALEAMVPTSGMVTEITINGRTKKYGFADLRALAGTYRYRVWREENPGRTSPRHLTRFRAAR
jgi:hypothetical protein